MEIKYNRDDIDENLSMGENALLYYDDILEKKVMNRIIISTILRLHKKGYTEINNGQQNELIIKIKDGTENLKISEKFIYEILKFSDIDDDGIVSLDELNATDNKIFAKNKKNIKQLIIQEAMSDDLISKEKFKEKRKYFFRTLEILMLIIWYIINIFLDEMGIAMILSFVASLYVVNFIKINDELKKLKKKLINDQIMQYRSEEETINIIKEIFICIIIYYVNEAVIKQLYKITLYTMEILLIELIFALIFAVISYIKFAKTDVYADKAILDKQKLVGLEEYLTEYSLIQDRKAVEIYLWEDYLTFAVLLGINNNITSEIKLNLSKV